jgi:hypothetical protein
VILVVNEGAIDPVVDIRLADAVEVTPALLNRLRDFGGALRALLLDGRRGRSGGFLAAIAAGRA